MKKKILVVLAVALASASAGAAIACAVNNRPKQYEYYVLFSPKGEFLTEKAYNLVQFKDLINRKLADGWKLIGGIAMDDEAFYQTIYREKKPQKNDTAGANAPEGGTK